VVVWGAKLYFSLALMKKYVLLTCLKDTCQSYMWIVENFLQTGLKKILVLDVFDTVFCNNFEAQNLLLLRFLNFFCNG
jgi:hypothetical protein